MAATVADDMTPVFELAGLCAAEALLNLSGSLESAPGPGEAALLPSLAIQNPRGKRVFTVFDSPAGETFEKVEELLGRFAASDLIAVVTSDGYVTIDGRRLDAVELAGHLLSDPRRSFVIVVPYVHPDGGRPFGFGRPRVASHDGFDVDAVDADGAFARGRDGHEHAGRIWQTFFRPAL